MWKFWYRMTMPLRPLFYSRVGRLSRTRIELAALALAGSLFGFWSWLMEFYSDYWPGDRVDPGWVVGATVG